MKKQRIYLTYKHVEFGLTTLAFRSTKSMNRFLEYHRDDILYLVEVTDKQPNVKYSKEQIKNAVNLLEGIVLRMEGGDESELV